MKTQPYRRFRREYSTPRLAITLAIASAVLAVVMPLASCGGTFSLSPTGVVSYTTPEIIKVPIITPEK